MDAETGFLIDDRLYEVPVVYSLNMDEAQILYDYSGLTIQDFLSDEDAEDDHRFDNPGVYRALMHIAYQRGNPDLRPARVRELIGRVQMFEALSGLVPETEEVEDEESLPPASASTSTPDGSSEKRTSGSSGSPKPTTSPPGNGSQNGSAQPANDPTHTGVSRSATQPTSPPLISGS